MDVVIGRIVKPHGVRGEVSVELRTDEPETRFAPGNAVLTDPADPGPLTVTSARPHGGRWLVAFDEVPDRGAAEGLRGVLLLAAVDEVAEPEGQDEFYDRQLVGLRVYADGADQGEVVRVEHHPAHDVLVVRRGDGADALVPFVAELVPDVDLAAGRLTIADRPGLLDPETLE